MPGGGCQMFDPLCCDDQGGTPQGLGTTCGTMIACCFNGGTVCQTMDILCCDDEGGIPSPIGAPACLGDVNPPNGVDDACEFPTDTTGACCFDEDSTCANLTESDCQAQGGDYKGDGTMCLGDNDGNGIDDACDGGFQGTKMHFPQLPDPAGWDVMSMYPVVTVADDWRCTQSGYITDIYWWGSWFDGVPNNILSFFISFWTDIPAVPGSVPYSRPGDEIWSQHVPYDQLDVTHVDGWPYWEGWLVPYGTYFENNHQWFEMYHLQLPEQLWFVQYVDTIYWISIMAEVAEEPPWSDWGWKSSYRHFNDDAAWSFWDPPFVWSELYEPLSGTGLNYIPGDVDGNGVVDVADQAYLTAYLFTQGPDPVYVVPGSNPPFFAAADCNGDCVMPPNAADLAALIDGTITFCEQYPPGTAEQSMDMAFVLINNCCIDTVGSVQLVPILIDDPPCDPFEQQVDISDLTNMIDHMFISFRPVCCLPEGDISPLITGGVPDGVIDISDLTDLIDHLFINYPALPPCP